VQQKPVGDVPQSFKGFVVAGGDGLLAEVAAGHDQRLVDQVQEEVVKWRVGQHHSHACQPRCDRPRQRSVGNHVDQHDGTLDRFEHRHFRVAESGECFGLGRGPHHYGERLGLTVFPVAQLVDRVLVGGVDRQVESAQSPEGHDGALPQCFGRGFQRRTVADQSSVG